MTDIHNLAFTAYECIIGQIYFLHFKLLHILIKFVYIVKHEKEDESQPCYIYRSKAFLFWKVEHQINCIFLILGWSILKYVTKNSTYRFFLFIYWRYKIETLRYNISSIYATTIPCMWYVSLKWYFNILYWILNTFFELIFFLLIEYFNTLFSSAA